MNSKKAITLLVLATLIIGLIPTVSAAEIDIDTVRKWNSTAKTWDTFTTVRKGNKLQVIGNGVTAGATVNGYWDNALIETFVDGEGKLNSTKAKKNGSYEVWLKVPEGINGLHYIWVKDVSSGNIYGGTGTIGEVTVVAYVSLSPSTGLPGDTITVSGYGFGEEADFNTLELQNDYGTDMGATFSPALPVTSELGSFTSKFKIPSIPVDVDYYVYAEDEDTNWDDVTLTVGPSVTLSATSGPVGKVVQITGRGFTKDAKIDTGDVQIYDGATTYVDCYVFDGPITVKYDGTFKFSIVAPQVADTGDFEIIVTETGAGTRTSSADFEVLGLAKVKATPSYGSPGSKVTVEGWNFTQKTGYDVDVSIEGLGEKTFKTDSKGYFKGTFTVPAALTFDVHDLIATQAEYLITDAASFRVGLMVVILSPDSGPTGTLVTVMGSGFTKSGAWNATFGSLDWVDDEAIDSDGNLLDYAYVPSVAPGTYTVTLWDVDEEIELFSSFVVTKTTTVTADPLVAPNKYPVEFNGYFFAADDESGSDVTLDWVLWNSTDSWDMDVLNRTTVKPYVYGNSYVWDSGNFTAYWDVPDDDVLDLGVYWVNVTDGEDLFYQFQFEIVSKTTAITARKVTFKISEVVAFNVESSFKQEDSYIKIWDPSGNLYWKTDLFVTGNWIKVSTLQVYPFYQQTAGGNPMTLLEDAPLGTYTWKWYDNKDEVVSSGTFMVAAATESVLGKQIEDLNTAVTSLASDITTVSTEVAAVRTQITNAINAANAAVTAANAATQAVNAVATTASAANTAATNAAAAATEARNAANGLTTLVYGAIGASLVAALAAIVSLMQISRRIAG